MLAQAGAIRWYVDRVGYLSKRMIFFQNSDLKLIESPCIQYFVNLANWSTALENCRNDGGDLASIHSNDEDRTINSKFVK